MESVRSTWTDERLDDLNHRVDQRFDGVDKRFDAVDRRIDELGQRMDNGFNRVDEDLRSLRIETRTEFGILRGEMSSRFERVDARFDAMQRTMIQFGGGMIVALLGLIVTVALQH